MAVAMWIFVLAFIPMALIIGLASSTIGFTAWNIAVPLVFVGFGFDLYNALYLSIIIDLFDAILLTIIYAKNKKVDFKAGALWSVVSLIGAAIAFLFSKQFLANNSDFLRGGVGYLVMLISFTFLYKGFKLSKERKSSKDESIPSIQDELEPISKKPKLPLYLVIPIMILGVGISGGLGGMVGMGSGMNFVILFIVLLNFDLLKATGTGCFMMMILMIFAAIAFGFFVDFIFIWPYLIIGVLFSAIGTLIGAKFALKLPKEKLNFLVGSAILIAAIVATVQSYIFA